MPTTIDIEKAFQLSLKLSQIAVDGDKAERLRQDLSNILDYVASIEAIPTDDVEPIISPLELVERAFTPMRADQAEDQALLGGDYPDQERDEDSRLYLVPAILNRDD